MYGGTGSYTTAMIVATDPETMMLTTPGAINGAIRERSDGITAPVLTIIVESIDEHIKKITEAGGKVVEDKQTVENIGHYAYVADSDNNVIGLWENIAR